MSNEGLCRGNMTHFALTSTWVGDGGLGVACTRTILMVHCTISAPGRSMGALRMLICHQTRSAWDRPLVCSCAGIELSRGEVERASGARKPVSVFPPGARARPRAPIGYRHQMRVRGSRSSCILTSVWVARRSWGWDSFLTWAHAQQHRARARDTRREREQPPHHPHAARHWLRAGGWVWGGAKGRGRSGGL